MKEMCDTRLEMQCNIGGRMSDRLWVVLSPREAKKKKKGGGTSRGFPEAI